MARKNTQQKKPSQAEIDETMGMIHRVLKEVIPNEKYTLTAKIEGRRVAFKFESESNVALGAWKLLTSVMASMHLGNFGEE